MNFNTLDFLLVFLPLVLLIFYAVPPVARLWVLLLSSFVFYGVSGALPLMFLVVAIAWGFAAGFVQRARRSVGTVLLAVSGPALILWAFKYLGFTIDVLRGGPAWSGLFEPILLVTLPAGISFYTFQVMSYSLDLHYQKTEVERNPVLFAAYVSFFAQLIAGPIVRLPQIRDQLRRLSVDARVSPDIRGGVKFLAIGLFAKIFFADVLLHFHQRHDFLVDPFFDRGIYSILSYSMIIYYDFWSYSIMAIGIGRLFGLELPVNFREPYLARSPVDFWAGWHITLTTWLRDYLFFPMSRVLSRVVSAQRTQLAYSVALVATFLIVGLWHGAGYSFVAWGAYHAALIIGYHLVKKPWDRLPRVLSVGLTFLLVSLAWPLFYMELGEYGSFVGRLLEFQLSGDRSGVEPLSRSPFIHWGWLAMVIGWTFVVPERVWLWAQSPRNPFNNAVVQALLVYAAIVFLRHRATFIYFRF